MRVNDAMHAKRLEARWLLCFVVLTNHSALEGFAFSNQSSLV